jgi:hypothetical protein
VHDPEREAHNGEGRAQKVGEFDLKEKGPFRPLSTFVFDKISTFDFAGTPLFFGCVISEIETICCWRQRSDVRQDIGT